MNSKQVVTEGISNEEFDLTQVRRRSKGFFKAKTKEGIVGYIFVSLWIIGFLVFTLVPLITSLYYSFTNFNKVDDPTFLGLDNYIYIFTKDTHFWPALGRTVMHVILGTSFSIVTGILLAVILNKPIKGMGIWRTIFYLPNVVSSVAMALLWTWMFNRDFGLINQFLALFGIPNINWLGEHLVRYSLILMSAWGAGISALFFLGAMKGIPKTLYESADISGASKIRQFFTITLPLITPTILFMLITTIIGNFQYWINAYVMVGYGENFSAYYLGFYLYEQAFKENALGYASALSWVMFIIVISAILAVFKTSKKWVHYLGTN